MEEIFHKVLRYPPTKWVNVRKKIKIDKDGNLKKEDTYYLTANLFYDGTHWAIKNKIMKFAKEWIVWQIKEVPELEKCRIKLVYHHPTDTFDLDNKLYFWVKVILDIMKTPSQKQILNAEEFKNPIITINSLKDDTVRFIDQIYMEYERGPAALELQITGRRASVQSSLF